MEGPNDVGAVIHRDVGLMRNGGANVLVVRLVVLALDREDLDAVIAHEVGGDIVLRREWVRGAERHVGATGLERNGEVRGFRRDVQTGGDTLSLERTLLGEPRLDLTQHRHGALRPLRAAASLIGERQIPHIVLHRCASARLALRLRRGSHCFQKGSGQRTARLSASARSVRSQENSVMPFLPLPNFCGSRPKCPYAAVAL